MQNKLFLTGPTEIRPEVLEAMTRSMIGHRGKPYAELQSSIIDKMKVLTGSPEYEHFLFTSSGSGVMEAAIRNCVKNKVLHTVCGAFSDRWREISVACDKEVGVIEVDYGEPITPEMIDKELAKGDYEAVTVTHNETSTGVINPLAEIAKIVKKYPEVLFLVDAVSSFGGVKINPQELGIDVLVFSTQKCLALPPGLAFGIVSPRAIKKSAELTNKGFYFDFLVMKKYADKSNTPSTPAISLMYATEVQLDYILKEGIENREARHREEAEYVRNWVKEKGFKLLAKKGYESPTLTAVKNNLEIESSELIISLAQRGYAIASAYGKLKGTGFRIGNMGDWKIGDIKELLNIFERILEKKKG